VIKIETITIDEQMIAIENNEFDMIDDRMLEDDFATPIEEPRGAPSLEKRPQPVLQPTMTSAKAKSL
jgi:hypothetical protein